MSISRNSKLSSRPNMDGDSKGGKFMKKYMNIPIALGLAILVSGCAGRVQNLEVGSIPDDYRTRHPIVINEQDKALDIPVSNYATRMNVQTRETIQGFAQNYLQSNASYLTIMKPAGSENSASASDYARKVSKTLSGYGVPASQITIVPYDANSYGQTAPIRLVYTALVASTEQCGQWKEDMLANSSENKNYYNFGCATQNNIANQIANPLDLVRPRGSSPVDATRRSNAIEGYQDNGAAL